MTVDVAPQGSGLPEIAPVNLDLDEALSQMKSAAGAYEKAERYYDGDTPEIFASIRVRRMLARWGMNFDFNFAATPVNAVAERLKVTSVTSEDDSLNPVLQKLMDDNMFALQGSNVMRKASTFGDAYVLVWPEIEDGEQTGNINIFYQDPRLVRVFYRDDNPLKVKFAIKRWQVGKGLPKTTRAQMALNRPADQPPIRVDLYYPDRIERYVSKKGTKGTEVDDFVPYQGDEDDDGDTDWVGGPVLPNPYGVVPMFHFKTDADDYGQPEHKGFYAIQDMIHKLINNFAVVIDYQSFPQRVALMMDGSDSTEPAAVDEGYFAIDYEQEGVTYPLAGEAQSQMSADPASIWYLQGIKSIQTLDPADPTSFTGPVNDLITWGATITTTPLNRFSPGGNPASGESLKITDAPFVEKIDTRKLSYGATWKSVFEFALLCLGYTDPVVSISWAPSASSDNLADWQVAKAKQDGGVPVSQTLAENGYPQDKIADWMAKGQADLPQRLSNLVTVGEFLASAATAVAAGAIDTGTVSSILTSIMGDLGDTTEPAD